MRKILVIEDSEADQFYNQSVIESIYEDIELYQAYDGEEALEILNSGVEPDIILLDINMPRMNGHEFLDTYYRDTGKDIPVVIMLTSSDQERDKQKTSHFKCVQDYFLKPLTEDMAKKLPELVKIKS